MMNWKPLQTEFAVMTKKQRGIIDSIEFINNNGELRILDYKKNKHPNDRELLYFYANLLEDFMGELDWEDLVVTEIGCYYYQAGNLYLEKYDLDEQKDMKEKIKAITNEIENENLPLIKDNCSNCQYQMICKIEENRFPR